MFKKQMFWAILTVLATCLFQSCVATKAYRTAMESGSRFEARQDYINAYSAYKKALAENKDDEAAKNKLETLGKKIAQDFTGDAKTALNDGRLRDAEMAFDKALTYRSQYPPALQGKIDLARTRDVIKKNYERAAAAQNKNEWIDAVAILQGIKADYKDDPQLAFKIDQFIHKGYGFYRNQGHTAWENRRYKEALAYFNKAQNLKSDNLIKNDISKAEKLIKADEYYRKALGFNQRNALNAAFSALVDAKKISRSHSQANRLYQALLPKWSKLAMAQGLSLLENEDHTSAYGIFKQLYTHNPGFPQAEHQYMETREILLKLKYRLMVDRLKQQDWIDVLERGNEIYQMVEDGFLYSPEIYAYMPLMTYNMFIQRGEQLLNAGHYGKAVLAFRSAEDQLGETAITQGGIKHALDKMAATTRLTIAFWNFKDQSKEAGVSGYASNKLKKALASALITSPLKNIVLKYRIISDDEMNLRSDSNSIDWGLIQSKSCNSLLTGEIESLRIDNARQSEWKTRIHKVKRIVDNKAYLTQVIKLARLNNALMNKVPEIVIEGQTIPKIEYKSQIGKIEAALPGISPKVEAEVEEKTSYQVEKYTMTAAIRMDVSIFYQNGALVWPSTVYEDKFEIEDLVIAPDLQSSIPEERAGDPLVLPSNYEFTQMALDHIIETKIIPDLKTKLEDYGTRFFESGKRHYPLDSSGDVSQEGFSEAVEDYYKFLTCYRDKGESDDKTEQVTRLLDRFISLTRLLGSDGF